jgi:argininosuccinate lyase
MGGDVNASRASEAGLFASIKIADDRLDKYAIPLKKQLFLPLNVFDKAHCVMLCERGIVSPHDAASILRVLTELDRLGPDGFPWGKGDLWAQKEKYVVDQIGEAVGGRLHTGRSRQDVGVTVNRLYLRARVLDMAEHVNEFRRLLLDVCKAHVDTIMPCYTWMQHAQVTTFAHYLLAFVYALARDTERIARAYELTNMSPAGAALQTGTSHPLDRHRVAELLGFAQVIRNTRDAAMNFDYLNEIAVSASLTVLDLLRMLEDFTVWHSQEFDAISLGDAWCGTSSIMPQKRNPLPLMMIRGKASKILCRTMATFSMLESPTLGPPAPFYLQSDVDEGIDEFLAAFVLACGFLPTVTINKTRLHEAAAAHWSQATDLADTIVRERGLSFRTAHHVIAELVVTASRGGIKPTDVTPAMIDEAAERITGNPLRLTEATVKTALDPLAIIAKRSVFGGTTPDDVVKQINESRERLEADIALAAMHRGRIAQAAEDLDVAVHGHMRTDPPSRPR